ncbi:unnamed protein product [Bursaphelenchus okinawaensis]|uniref:Uncharacterized protein n=1 Tax=Bursaphelenchus okinawaensis TaxID=465554 RepID=A0A811K3N2_9BILA|nr:unnamed protein product [Bursaphelenchus okinawaensis]CAG9091272.1 unnamed protein product [Bursaphelenchus okinawaensis]
MLRKPEHEVFLDDDGDDGKRKCSNKVVYQAQYYGKKLRNLCYFSKITILICTLILSILFYNMYQSHLRWIEKLPLDKTYIVLSSDLSMYYLMHAPLAIMYWNSLGVKAILLITLKENENVDDDNLALSHILNFLEGGAMTKIIYFRNYTIPSGRFAQTVRAFAAGTEFAHSLPDDTVFITSDVDFFPSKIENHVPRIYAGNEIFIYDNDCCRHMYWHGERYKEYIMITVGMTLRKWREVIELPMDTPVTSKFIDTHISETFDNNWNNKKVYWLWFLDQRFFSLKFKHWIDKHQDEYDTVVRSFYRKRMPRLERFDWPNATEFENMNVWKRYESAHIAPGVILDPVWETNLPFYKKILSPGQLKAFAVLRDFVIKNVDVKEVTKYHYHPEQNDPYWKRTFHIKGMQNKTKHFYDEGRHKRLALS